MRTFALVGVCLLFGVLAGVVLRPDDGTQVSLSPAETGAVVSGADHAKPLPRVPTPAVDIVREFMALSALVLAALFLAPPLLTVVRLGDDPRPPALALARAGARRGPPARA